MPAPPDPTDADCPADFRESLLSRGILENEDAALTPLTGGVSSEIYRVEDGGRVFVIKRALEKLKVESDWYADVSRNRTEQEFIRYLAAFRPDAAPRLLAADDDTGCFCMEFLDGFANWKEELLAGRCETAPAETAGALLGELHRRSHGNADARERFDTTENFDQLRVDPYLRATAAHHSDLSDILHKEADRLLATRECLVHGDFSPKNILHREGRLVALDCEVAWYGDPAFDLSFFLNHLFLKALYHAPSHDALLPLVDAALEAYRRENPEHAPEVETRTARLLPMLALARVDGKSPVEYLTDESRRDFVRARAREFLLESPPESLPELRDRWFRALGDC